MDLKDKAKINQQETINKILENLPSDTEMIVEVPSRCRFYDTKGPVIVKPLKYEDERILLSGRRSKLDPINLILSRCVEGINIQDILPMDKVFLLMKIREISYGEIYTFPLVCNNCKEESIVDVDLGNRLIINYIPEDITDPREVYLPKIKKSAKVRFPRVRDEQYLTSPETETSNLWRFVTEIDGCNDPVVIAEVVKKLHLIDMKAIVKEINRSDLGVIPKFKFHCGSCDYEEVMEVPLTPSFLSI